VFDFENASHDKQRGLKDNEGSQNETQEFKSLQLSIGNKVLMSFNPNPNDHCHFSPVEANQRQKQ